MMASTRIIALIGSVTLLTQIRNSSGNEVARLSPAGSGVASLDATCLEFIRVDGFRARDRHGITGHAFLIASPACGEAALERLAR